MTSRASERGGRVALVQKGRRWGVPADGYDTAAVPNRHLLVRYGGLGLAVDQGVEVQGRGDRGRRRF